MERGGKNPPPLFSFLNIFKTKKRYDFALLWLLVITYFERFCQKSCENFDWLMSYCDFVRGVLKNSKKTFFLKQLFLLNISSIHNVEVVNMIFFIWYIFLLEFENEYIRIGNFVVFLSESMELTSDRFFYLLCKTICFCLFFFPSIIKSVIHCHS